MSDHRHHIDRIFEEGTPIDEAMRRAGRRAVLEHKREGLPLAVWRDGRVVWIPPEELEVEGEDSEGAPSAKHELG